MIVSPWVPARWLRPTPVFILDMANHQFDSLSPSHFPLDGRRHPPLLACGEDPDLVGIWRFVATAAGIGENVLGLGSDDTLHVWDHRC